MLQMFLEYLAVYLIIFIPSLIWQGYAVICYQITNTKDITANEIQDFIDKLRFPLNKLYAIMVPREFVDYSVTYCVIIISISIFAIMVVILTFIVAIFRLETHIERLISLLWLVITLATFLRFRIKCLQKGNETWLNDIV